MRVLKLSNKVYRDSAFAKNSFAKHIKLLYLDYSLVAFYHSTIPGIKKSV